LNLCKGQSLNGCSCSAESFVNCGKNSTGNLT
ncbi:hypothetical protein T4A_12462, partial [Trichinella pseudospiralis]